MKYYNSTTQQYEELTIKALDSMPLGSVIQFVGTTIPTGWLECNGATITQSEYPELYELIGGTLPNFKGRVLVGQDTNDSDFDTLLETGGSKYLQAHRHKTGAQANYYGAGPSGSDTCQVLVDTTNGQETSETGTGNSGNLQPYAVVKHIIKAKNTTPTMASIVDTYSTSTQDGYSCSYINGLQPEVLWSGTATSNTITLDKATTGYSYIEVYGYATDSILSTGNRVFAKIDNPLDCAFYLSGNDIDTSGGVLYLKTATCVINSTGTQISIANNYQWYQVAGSTTGGGSSAGFIKIYKVVGYK